MSKKNTIKANSANTTHGNIEISDNTSDLDIILDKAKEGKLDSAVYLRDTLIQMDEFKKYGLNQYFLRAILKENYYTLDKAHKLVQDFLNNH